MNTAPAANAQKITVRGPLSPDAMRLNMAKSAPPKPAATPVITPYHENENAETSPPVTVRTHPQTFSPTATSFCTQTPSQ